MSLINKLVLGTVQLGLNYGINNSSGQPSENESLEILKFANANGINFLDTAEAYNASQEIIGKFHSSATNRFQIITKFSEESLKKSSDIREVIYSDFETLKTNSLYGYLFHNIETYTKYFDRRIFKYLKNKKKIIKIGVSVYTNEQAMIVAEDPEIEIIQMPFNLLDNTVQRGTVFKFLKSRQKEIHVRSIFLQGLLIMNKSKIPQKLQPLSPYINMLDDIANNLKLTVQQLAIAYALNNKMIDKVLIGSR